MLCSETMTITKCLVRFGQTNLGRPFAIPHLRLDLKSIDRPTCTISL